MPPIHRCIVLTAALIAALAFASLPPSAASAGPPARAIRVVITVHGAAISPGHPSGALRSRLTVLEQRILRSKRTRPGTRAQVRAMQKTRRAGALRLLTQPGVTPSPLRSVSRRLMRLGAQLESVDPLTGRITVNLAPLLAAAVREWPHVARVDRAAARPVAQDLTATYVGADAWWNAGFNGGTGAADSAALAGDNPPTLAIVDVERIVQNHPAFTGITFESPADAPARCTNMAISDCLHPSNVLTQAAGRAVATCPVAPSYTCNNADLDATPKGVAPGLRTVLDVAYPSASSPTDYFGGWAWMLGITQRGRITGTVLPGATDPAEIQNESLGSLTSYDDTTETEQQDLLVSTYGLFNTISCGNYGPGAGTIASPGLAPDVMCVGAYTPNQLDSPSDDAITSYSSIGPTPAGRKKPDIVAVGEAAGANARWQTTSSLWTGASGTSFSAPQVAGAGALLMASGISDPLAIKAMLIDSARQGRATPVAAMGTQTGWQPDWGWGALDLTAAFAQRTNFATAAVPADDAHFYRATTTAAGDRATLVWNRRVDGAVDQTLTMRPLTNLNLYEYDQVTGAQRTASTSIVDNVEQTRTPGAGTVIYKVAAGPIAGASSEPYAIAATRQVTPLVSPKPAVSLSLDHTLLGPGATATATLTATNASSDLDAANATLDLASDSGAVSVTPLDAAPAGGLAKGQAVTRHFLIAQLGDGDAQLTATATDTAYASTLTTTATRAVRADIMGPATAIDVPAGAIAASAFSVRWAASDPSGVATYEAELAEDDGPFRPLSSGTGTAADVPARAGHRYRVRVRAVDGLGNVSPWLTSSEIAVPAPGAAVATPPSPPAPAPVSQPATIPPRAHADDIRLTMRTVRTRGRALTLRLGAPHARRTARLTFTARRGARRIRLAKTASLHNGAAVVTLVLPPGPWRDGRVTVSAAGGHSVTRTVVLRNGRATLR